MFLLKKSPARKQPSRKGFHLTVRVILVILMVAFAWQQLPQKQAQACCGCCFPTNTCTWTQNAISQATIVLANTILRAFITQQFYYQQRWFMHDFWYSHVLPAMMQMTQSLTTTAEMQVMAFGVILDAKENLERERLLREKVAEAHKDYSPDLGMCTIGTAAQSLAASDRIGEVTSISLTKRMIDRQLNVKNSAGTEGNSTDSKARIGQLRTRFCDPNANGKNWSSFCTAPTPGNINRDINYAATIGVRRTLNLNLTNGGLEAPDDENVLALVNNLYGYKIFEIAPMPTTAMDADKGWKSGETVSYLDRRAVIAKRSVAQNSFSAIVGMKAAGSAASANAGNYLYEIFRQLGATSATEAQQMLGSNPSYYALLEAVSQKIYQDPDFYTNLYDKPTNVLRKKVAMQAINLMLDRDTYKSELRMENLLAVLLETEMVRYQTELSSRLNLLSDQTAPLP